LTADATGNNYKDLYVVEVLNSALQVYDAPKNLVAFLISSPDAPVDEQIKMYKQIGALTAG